MDKEILYKGKYQKLCKIGTWEFLERVNCTGIVMIMPQLTDGRIILVEQYRVPVQSRVIEFPAGLAGDIPEEAGESMKNAAVRELWEETGYEAGEMTLVAQGPPSPGMCSETIDFFVARDLKKTGPGGGDDSEDIIIHVVDIDKAADFLAEQRARGVMIDPKVYMGLWFLEKHQGANES
ncbi:MAG: NUDIX hydrolase [Spirochaetales bacterium]|nr:NUDIX hydrolase [Spirochaetales bacterium]